MGLFKKAKRSLGYEDDKLRERGIQGTAKVLSSEKTMLSEDDGSGRNVHIYKHHLLVTVPGAEPYEVTYRKAGPLTDGGEYRMFVDPKDPNNVFVDHAAMAREHAADELSQFTHKPVGADAESILGSAAGLVEDAQKQMFTAPPGAPPPAPAPRAPSTQVSQGDGYRMILISRLDARHDKGEITDEEYKAEKRKIQGGGPD
jgi:putative oligomerization/nucleic acid binding protein